MKIALIFLVLLLSGCTPQEAVYFEKVKEEEAGYEMYIETGALPSVFDGKKTGAGMPAGERFSYISEFEEYMGVSHDIYMKSITLGDEVPLSFLMDSYINGKLPLVRIFPPKDTDIYSLGSLIISAKEFGKLNIPVVIDFYPVTSGMFDFEEYKRYYRTAFETFGVYAQNVSLMWSIDSGMAGESFAYYPGDDFVSAVGADITISSREIGEPADGIYKSLSFLNYSFQRTKPLIVSSLKVSHYSAETLSYTTAEAGRTINGVYACAEAFPAIRAVVYDDADYTGSVFNRGENFSISDTSELRRAYRDTVSGFVKNKKDLNGYIKSWYSARRIDGEFYVPYAMAYHELGLRGNTNGDISLSELSPGYIVDKKNRRLYIEGGI